MMSDELGTDEEVYANPEVAKVFKRCTAATNWISLIGAGLDCVPSAICERNRFPFLTQLYLGHNKISVLPVPLCELVSLRGLYLQNNSLVKLPLELGRLTDLQELYLSTNVLVSVPSTLTSLVSLDCFWLDDNPTLPQTLCRNISRNKGSVQELLQHIGGYYGPLFQNAQRAIVHFLLCCSSNNRSNTNNNNNNNNDCNIASVDNNNGDRDELSGVCVLPREIQYTIAKLVWDSRCDAKVWSF
jgi:Leucine-rich repeat (LRR) protein